MRLTAMQRSIAEMLKHVNSITVDQFQADSHDFIALMKSEAVAEAARYNERGVRGAEIVAVQLGEHYCVMTRTAAEFVANIGIGEIVS